MASPEDKVSDTNETLVSQPRKKSLCWQYFDIVDHAKWIARCRICQSDRSFRTSVSNLQKHLNRVHQDELSSDTLTLNSTDNHHVVKTIKTPTSTKKRSHDDSTTDAESDGGNWLENSEVVPQRRKRNQCWYYFDIVDQARSLARCKYCHRDMSFRTSVSNLMKHIRRSHANAESGPVTRYTVNPRESTKDNGNNNDSTTDEDSDSGDWLDENLSENRSTIWEYFRCLDERLKIAICLACEKRMTYSSLDSLWRHVKKRHQLADKENEGKNIIISESGEFFEVEKVEKEDSDAQEQGDVLETETVTYKDLSKILTVPKKRAKMHNKFRIPRKKFRPALPVKMADSAAKSETQEPLYHFLQYLSTLMSKLPENVSNNLQANFIRQAIDAQVAETASSGSNNDNVVYQLQMVNQDQVLNKPDAGETNE